MKKLTVIAAGLGWHLLERRKATSIAGLRFEPRPSVFPAVTCVAQATLRTGLSPAEHGMLSNGVWLDDLQKPSFWEQSCRFVKGPRVWSRNSGVFFFQQSLGEDVELILSPAPIHKHGGGMVMSCYTKPTEMAEELRRRCGTFPLWRYWGPLASPKVGRAVVANFEAMVEETEPDWALLYLPTLDYAAQREGPDSAAHGAALEEFRAQLERLADFAQRRNAAFTVAGDYAIHAVDAPPAFPNAVLRAQGFFNVRPVAGRAYPDFYTSRAFAMCDHEIAHVYVRDPADVPAVAAALKATGAYESCMVRADQDWAHPSAGELLLVAKKGSWCAYPWWTDPREAPDWATHIDIHNKPGYDPSELFFGGFFPPRTCQDHTRIKGTHGRPCATAWASTASVSLESPKNLARLFAEG